MSDFEKRIFELQEAFGAANEVTEIPYRKKFADGFQKNNWIRAAMDAREQTGIDFTFDADSENGLHSLVLYEPNTPDELHKFFAAMQPFLDEYLRESLSHLVSQRQDEIAYAEQQRRSHLSVVDENTAQVTVLSAEQEEHRRLSLETYRGHLLEMENSQTGHEAENVYSFEHDNI